MEEPRAVFRFVHVADREAPFLADDFRCDREVGLRASSRERAYPELQDGMSAYGAFAAAQRVWETLRAIASARGEDVRVGNYIAEVELAAGQGFSLEDLGEEDQHLTIWGEKGRLAGAVGRICPAATREH